MKYKEFENEDALDLMANILTPAAEIFTDPEIKDMARANANKLVITQAIIKNHKSALITIFAALDGTPVEEYHANIITLTKNLIELMSDEEFTAFFT